MSMRAVIKLSALLGAVCLGAATPIAAFAQEAPAAASSAAEYRLGSGDVVRINVYQNPDLTLEARISESGTMSFPLLGTVKIGGLVVSAAEKLIADGLRNGNFVKQPQVSLLVAQVRGNQVSVLGQVNRPGRFPLEVVDMRLSDLLATAGGIAPTGADTVTLVGVRDGKPIRRVLDLPAIFRSANRDDDVMVQNGDVLFVDRALALQVPYPRADAPIAYIYGEVQRPGTMRVERDMTVMQALASGGGLTLRGTAKGLRVHRRAADGKMQILQPDMDDPLKDGDVVYVRESLF